MKVKIISCKNNILWYADRINEQFSAIEETKIAFWVRNEYGIDWVYKEDVEVSEQV